jgi:hypothetical protein
MPTLQYISSAMRKIALRIVDVVATDRARARSGLHTPFPSGKSSSQSSDGRLAAVRSDGTMISMKSSVKIGGDETGIWVAV